LVVQWRSALPSWWHAASRWALLSWWHAASRWALQSWWPAASRLAPRWWSQLCRNAMCHPFKLGSQKECQPIASGTLLAASLPAVKLRHPEWWSAERSRWALQSWWPAAWWWAQRLSLPAASRSAPQSWSAAASWSQLCRKGGCHPQGPIALGMKKKR